MRSKIFTLATDWKSLIEELNEQFDHGSQDNLCSMTYRFFTLCQNTFFEMLPVCENKKIVFIADAESRKAIAPFQHCRYMIGEIGCKSFFLRSVKNILTGNREAYFYICGRFIHLNNVYRNVVENEIFDTLKESNMFTYGELSYEERRSILRTNIDMPQRFLGEIRRIIRSCTAENYQLTNDWSKNRRLIHFVEEFGIFDKQPSVSEAKPIIELEQPKTCRWDSL